MDSTNCKTAELPCGGTRLPRNPDNKTRSEDGRLTFVHIEREIVGEREIWQTTGQTGSDAPVSRYSLLQSDSEGDAINADAA